MGGPVEKTFEEYAKEGEAPVPAVKVPVSAILGAVMAITGETIPEIIDAALPPVDTKEEV